MELLDLLKTLVTTPGPSGAEGDIATVIAEIWRPFVDEIKIDALGNVIATKVGSAEEPRPRLLLSAHMDEIGLLVSEIVEHNGYGFLRVSPVGGIDRRQILAQRVTVHGKRNLTGVMGALPSSALDDSKRGKVYDFEDLLVDVGLSAETTRNLISIGDFVTFNQPVHELLGGNIAAKALDNRASVAALTLALEMLQGRAHQWDILFAATIQEETRLLGGFNVGYSQRPDLAVAFDVSHAKQSGVVDPGAYPLGSGPIFDIGVNVHPAVLQQLRDAASALEMSTNILTHGRHSGTETAAIQLSHAGVPTGLVSIPIRYMHTMVETVNLKDIERVGRLTAEFAARLDSEFLSNITKSLFVEK
jgi:endoglucanase